METANDLSLFLVDTLGLLGLQPSLLLDELSILEGNSHTRAREFRVVVRSADGLMGMAMQSSHCSSDLPLRQRTCPVH